MLQRLRITRLGEGLRATGRLHPAAAARTAAAVKEFVTLAAAAGARAPIVVGTHALRVARNPDELRARLPFSIETLSGVEEARLGYQGVLAGLRPLRSRTRLLVVDIGGGSVELTWGSRSRIARSLSLPIGAVVLTEQFLSHDPPLGTEIAALRTAVARTWPPHLSRIARGPVRMIGVGGTITTRAALDQRLDPYDPDRVHGYRLMRRAVDRITRLLLERTVAERRRLPGLQPERADIIVAGALVLQHLLARLRCRQITVSEADLLWALVLRSAPGRATPPPPGPETRA